MIGELLALPPEAKASDVIHRHVAQTVYVEVSDPAVVTDVDDPAAYAESNSTAPMKKLWRPLLVVVVLVVRRSAWPRQE